MNDRDAFLAAIRERPDDDAPRLIYADWLYEHGGEPARGEFIQVQVELSRLTNGGQWNDTRAAIESGDRRCGRRRAESIEPKRFNALRERERALLLSPCCQLGIDTTTVWPIEWSRGFVSSISARLAMLVGGPCERCDGTRPMTNKCPDCHGHGRTPGILPDVVRHPCVVLETVTATDATPWNDEIGDGFSWRNYDPAIGPNPQIGQLPNWLIDLMPYDRKHKRLDKRMERLGMSMRTFRTSDAAAHALSATLLAWARRQVEATPAPQRPARA